MCYPILHFFNTFLRLSLLHQILHRLHQFVFQLLQAVQVAVPWIQGFTRIRLRRRGLIQAELKSFDDRLEEAEVVVYLFPLLVGMLDIAQRLDDLSCECEDGRRRACRIVGLHGSV